MALPKSIVPQLTEMQERFAEYMSDTGDAESSAQRAGYAQPAIVGRQLAANPDVMIVVRYRTQLRIQGLVPHSLNFIADILRDKGAPKGVRLDAAKTILDRAGHIPPRAVIAQKSENVALNEMSVSELRRLLDEVERQRGDDARLLETDSAPILDANEAQPIDPME